MTEFNFDTKTIDYLIDKVDRTGITKLKLKSGEFEIEIEARPAPVMAAPSAVSVVAEPTAGVSVTSSGTQQEISGNVVKSPIIGTFYAAPSPDKEPYVKTGQSVKKGDVLFIVESMKLMNEIKSEYDGVVSKILVENGASVDYNHPIMVIE